MQSNRHLHSIGSYPCSTGSYFHSIGSYLSSIRSYFNYFVASFITLFYFTFIRTSVETVFHRIVTIYTIGNRSSTCVSIFNCTSCNYKSYVSRRTLDRGLGCLPFVRINRLGRALNNGKGFFQNQQTNRTKWRLPFALRFPVIVFG